MSQDYKGDLVFEPIPARQTQRRKYYEDVDAGGGLIVHKRWAYTYEPAGPDEDVPYRIRCEISWLDDEGHYDLDKVTIEAIPGGPRTVASYLRVIPLTKMAQSIGDQVVIEWPKGFDGVPDRRINLKVDPEDGMRRIALVHRVHEIFPANKATSALAEHYGVSISTAQRYVREARAAGLMQPTE